MAVEYITYKEEKHPVEVGYYALKHMQIYTKGKGVAHLQEDLSLYEPLLYYSLKMGAIAEGIKFDWKMNQMEFVLEQCLFKEFSAIVARAFTEDEDLEKTEEVKEPAETTSEKKV